MSDPLRTLLIDDNPDDPVLVMRQLRREFPDLQVEQISEAKVLGQALEAGDFGLVITDFQLRWSDGLAVLRAVKARCPDCSVIMFTDTGSEEIAVQAMKNGLDDYILTSPKHFIPLPAAVRLALKQVEDSIERERAEESLRESEERYRDLYENAPNAYFAVGADGLIRRCNRRAEELLGCALEELVGRPVFELYADTPQGKEKASKVFQRFRAGETVTDEELQMQKADGTPVWISLTVNAVRDAHGQVVESRSMVVDITERKRAEQLLRTLNEAALAVEQALTHEEIFTAVAEEFKKLGFSCMVFRTDESQSRLLTKYLSYEARALKAVEKLVGIKHEDFSIPVENVDAYRKVVWERKTVFVENAEEVMRQVLPEPIKRFAGKIVSMLKVPKSIPAPLIVADKVIGVFSVQSDDLTEEDMPAITAFAHQVAAAWRKAELLQDLERSLAEVKRTQEELQQSYVKLRRTLQGTVRILVSAIEMRDPYTGGHQRRVTQLACAIANEMGLSEEQIEGIRMAGLIHDLGKISIPAEILSSPRPLSDLQWGMIKAHSQVGYDILKTVEFPWPVAETVLQHHERLDGSGYPQGLSGKGILMKAKILAVADVVEAMASHRPYRPAHSIDKALEEISQHRGVLYDPEVVDVCLKLFTEKGFKFE